MPDKCCVPGCRSNYAGEGDYISVFRFPKDREKKQMWVRSIARANWEPSKYSVVCIKHFSENVISRSERYKDAAGLWKEYPRSRLELLPEAVPTIFPNLPSNLTQNPPPVKTDPEEERRKSATTYENKVDQWLDADNIKNFSSFYISVSSKKQVFDQWMVHCGSDYVVFYRCNFKGIPCITSSVTVNNELVCRVCVNNEILTKEQLKWILPGNLTLCKWSQLENLLSHYTISIKNEEI